ncbi:ATP-binding protein [Desulfopila sp. IMCC35008]|uniref:hybrid sensor histidine kinase/response regulator n=1 Tax=Desulfopila sp. IMCC35008 TaxID=2653858 RepID=UPI0013D2A836|nr:ATP-binding protein [Desulfopila sp. IMCC35008]
MRRNSITLKVLSLVISAFVVTTVSILFIANNQLTGIIDTSQNELYEEKVDTILTSLQRSHERLKKTGLVEAYSDDFRETALRDLRQTYYTDQDLRIYPFIIDTAGRIVQHPVLAFGDITLENTEIVESMLSSTEGALESSVLGQNDWIYFKKFPEWNWVIGYLVPLEIKYGDARKFRNLLILIMGTITLLAIVVLSIFIARFTGPISRLTDVATAMAGGDLEKEIELGNKDEVGMLARSFSHMRDSIQLTISELEKENIERKRAEIELAKEKEQLAVTLQSIGDGVITTDIHGNIILLNRVAEELTGWNRGEAQGVPLKNVFHLIDKDSREERDNLVDKVIDSGVIVEIGNHAILVDKDGRERNIANSGAPIRDARNDIIGVVLVFRDITVQLDTEKELLKTKKLESIGVLAGGIAHDFNNILTVILGNINLALIDNELKDNTKRLLGEAEKASVRAKELTQELLTFAKGGAPVKKVSSLENVIRDSANFVLHGVKVACRFDIPDDLWLVNIDAGQISQVIQNITLNSSHAMPDGGAVRIGCANVELAEGENGAEPSRKYVKISIADEGIGIPPNVVDRIFDPYYSTKKEGSGLGLAVCHSIITKHNGHITVESIPGEGTVLSIYLPASARQQDMSATENQVKEVAVGNLVVMVMDDEEQVRLVAEAILKQMGHRVILAKDGEEALWLYKKQIRDQEPVDLTIMDLTIPGGMGGQRAVREFLALDPEAKVIVSSGYSNDPIMANFREYGFGDALVKPYRMEELSRAISRIMSVRG